MSQTIILSNGDLVNIPDGADPAAVRKMHENRLARAANPRKPSRPKPRRTSKRQQRTRTLQALTGKATLQLIERVNVGTIPFSGEPAPYESEADDYGLPPAA